MDRSLPARGVWTEIPRKTTTTGKKKSLPARGVWIEIFGPFGRAIALAASLPARGVWIEMNWAVRTCGSSTVTPRKGSVD